MNPLIRRRLYISVGIVLFTMVLVGGFVFWLSAEQTVLAQTSSVFDAHKSANVSQVPLGGQVKYTIVLTNVSGAPVTPVVTDTLDRSLVYVEGSATFPQGVYVLSPNRGEVIFGFGRSMQSNEVVTLTFDVKVLTGTLQIGSVFTNTALIDPQTGIASIETNPVVLFVSQPPTVRIDDPVSGQLIEDEAETIKKITGVVWDTYDPAPFPETPTMLPVNNPETGNYWVQWSSDDDTVTAYVLEEDDNPDFSSPTYPSFSPPDSEQAWIVGKTAGKTYYYRVKAFNDNNLASSWSNVVSATVGSMALAYEMFEADVVETTSPLLLTASPKVELRINEGPWQMATLTLVEEEAYYYWSWSYDWLLPREDGVQYTIEARAADSGGNLGSVDTVTVTILNATYYAYAPIVKQRWPRLPYAPTLNAIANGDEDGDYEVSWSYGTYSGVPAPSSYVLQEARNSDFSGAVVYTETTLSKSFTDKEDGTYYYRVRAKNSEGLGAWSNTVSTFVQARPTYDYTFNNGNLHGWGIKRSDEGEGQQLPAPKSIDHSMYHLIVGSADFSILSPMDEAPALPYTIEGRVDIVDNTTIDDVNYTAKGEMTYGLIFGGNGGSPCPAERDDPNGCLSHYYRILVAYDQAAGMLKWSLKRIDYHEGDAGGGAGRGVTLRDWTDLDVTALSWNTWKVELLDTDSANIKVYINNKHLVTVTDKNYVNDPYFGVFMASPDTAGAIATKWDWIKVVPTY